MIKRARLLFWIPAFAGMTLGGSFSFAEEAVYSPEHCEFAVTFPGEPAISEQCEDGGKDRCYVLATFTKVYPDLGTSLNFRAVCNKADQTVLDAYNEEVIETTLRAMTTRSTVETHQSAVSQEDGFRHGTLIGEGRVGTLPSLYIAQIWVGKSSIFSIEAELIGEPADEPDKLYSEILKSVGVKKQPESAPKEPAAADEAKKD